MEHSVRILSIDQVTHNVRQLRVEKPPGYGFVAGQATDVAIDKEEWKDQKRPFTFTGLSQQPYLEFTIKCYTDHSGVTNELAKLLPGDRLLIDDVWGAIRYKGEGYFIAGGAGITPFIAILRKLHAENALGKNELFFCNRTRNDIILKDELEHMLGPKAVFILSQDHTNEYPSGRIDDTFLKQHITDFSKHFYVCGPDQMVLDINKTLTKLGANPETIVFEK